MAITVGRAPDIVARFPGCRSACRVVPVRVYQSRGGTWSLVRPWTPEAAVDPLPDLAEALAVAARSMAAERTVDDTLATIAHAARRSVPGFDHVGISTIDRRGGITTRAATDDLVNRLDDL